MNRMILAFAAMSAMAVPALAQDAAPLPKCSATVTDSCDQSTTTERYALTAAQAEKTGGVGDRAANRTAPKPMMHGPRRHHRAAKTVTTTTETQTITTPQQ